MKDPGPDPKAWRAASLRARLRGEAPPPAPIDRPEALAERAGSDPAAALWLRALAADKDQADRVARALLFEQARVQLPDGSALFLDEAETQLARKEEERVHAPLRAAVDETRAKTLLWKTRFDDCTSEERVACGEISAAFLAGTKSARDAAREMLGSIAGAPLVDPRSVGRALDLPSAAGQFSEQAALGLLNAAKQAAGIASRPLRRIRVPRRLVGLVLDAPDGVSFGTASPTLRVERHVRSVFGGAEALLRAVAPEGTPDDVLQAPARALGLGLLGISTRRSVLAESRADADRAERVVLATLLLEARVEAALVGSHLAVPPDQQASEEADRQALHDALGADGGRVFLHERLEGLDLMDFSSTLSSTMGTARALVALRDALDEGFSVRPGSWRAALEGAAGGPSPAGAAAATEAAAAWTQLIHERA